MINTRILKKEFIRIVIEEHEDYNSETIEVKCNNLWVPVIGNNIGYSTFNYWVKDDRYTKKLEFLKSKKKKIYYQLNDDDFFLNLDYCLEEYNVLHIRYKLSNNQGLKLSKLTVNYSIFLGDNPDYIWVPHLRPEKDLVMGDHIFRSPVLIYKKDKIAFAFIPDLKTLGDNRPFQTFMDFSFNLNNDLNSSQFSYGFGNYRPIKHVFFKHDFSKTWDVEKDTDLTFRYYIILFSNKNKTEILQFINDFFWKKYIRRFFYESLEPQILPYETNVIEGFKAIFERHRFWGSFTINNVDCGGIWQRSWAGYKKRPIEFIKPELLEDHKTRNTTETASSNSGVHKMLNEILFNPEKVEWFDKYTRRHAFVPRTAEVWNTAWFLNIRTAWAIRYFGEVWNNNQFIEKADSILNTLLNLPRINKIFPSIIFPAAPNSSIVSYINGSKAYLYSNEYNIVDASLAMYWALKYFQHFDKNKEIIEKSIILIDLIKKIQIKSGTIPLFIQFKDDKLIVNEILINSASSGAMLMFLCEFHKCNPNQELIPIMEKIANYIQKEIIPEDKWHDFEPFFSCTQLPLDFYDEYTNNHVKNTLCIYWCAEGFKELYKITNNIDYLRSGEHILAVLSLFQQVWNMPYISYNTFGGFGVQNADAELSDARQGLFVRTYMDYYLLTEKEEYMERGIAALRASWTLQLLKEYEEICPGNIVGIDTVDTIDKGTMYENYGHTGTDYRQHGQITFDWGIGTAAMATAYAKKHFGDIYIDFNKEFVFGIDGILIKSFEFNNKFIKIMLTKLQSKKEVTLKARNVPEPGIQVIVNESLIGFIEKTSLEAGFIFKI